MNYYSHHIGDFNNATRHLTRIERSIYRDMLDMYYDTEQPLSLDFNSLCRKLLARSNEEVTGVEQVLNEFFIKTSSGWFHSRCDEEITEYLETTTAKSKAGKASAEKRAQEKAARIAELNGNSTEIQQKSTGVEQVLDSVGSSVQLTNNQEPVTNNQEPLNPVPNDNQVQPTREQNEKDGAVVILPHVALSIEFRKHGVQTKPDHPSLQALVTQGVTPEVVASACLQARESKPNEQIGMTYVIRIIERWAREAASLKVSGASPQNARASPSTKSASRHSGFEKLDYSEGIENGRIA